ncbi:hypothetical protein POM88_042647 [Heracleum sosnowskyi]|uniref:MORF/ORRM1/DAG-like MORF domain-containing protein n=1 Tax=Heracleum sosnowskyi TaxID=360622 RepID=A0AAD8HH47_9APIA|nr:hypothetical protein POM88_042647 [Heracleum sosnowskyi]
MAGKYVARVLSSSTTTLLRKTPSFLRPIAALPNTGISPTAVMVRGLSSSEFKLGGLDFGSDGKHWLIWVKEPQGNPTREEIIDSYVNILAHVLGSEEEARMKIYSVSTTHYYAIGALIDEEICSKLRELPQVLSVNEDTYMDMKKKDYGGEPFIKGQPVPYDRKYHAAYWRMQEAMFRPPTGDQKDAKTQAPGSQTPLMDADSKWSTSRAWLSRVGLWWNGPSP